MHFSCASIPLFSSHIVLVSHFVDVFLSLSPDHCHETKKKRSKRALNYAMQHHFHELWTCFWILCFRRNVQRLVNGKWWMVHAWICGRGHYLWQIASTLIQIHYEHLEMALEIDKSIEWMQWYELRIFRYDYRSLSIYIRCLRVCRFG